MEKNFALENPTDEEYGEMQEFAIKNLQSSETEKTKNKNVMPENGSKQEKQVEKKEKKAEVLRALNEAVGFIEKIPEEKRTDREKWILKTVKDSQAKMDQNGKIQAGGESGFGSGEKKFIKSEGVPVDELIEYLKSNLGDSYLASLKEKAESLIEEKKNFDNGKTQEEQIKGCWYTCLRSLDVKGSGLQVDLLNEAENLAKKWEEADGESYRGMKKTNQLGEALRQVVEGRLVNSQKLTEEEKTKLQEVINVLEKNSVSFESSNKEERDERIKLESYYISQEKGYRKKADPEGDYYNGEKDLLRRKELVFSDQEEGIPVVPIIPAIPAMSKKEVFKRDARVVSVDENVRRMARRQVDDRMEELLHAPEEGMASNSRFRSILNNLSAPFRHPIRFGQKIWVRALERGYRNKFYEEALEQITQNQNLMVELERNHRLNRRTGVVDANVKREENFAFLDKVMEEYSNNAVEMEERGERITDPRLDAKTKRFFYSCLMASHRNGPMTRELFERKQRALMNGLKASNLITNADFLGRGNVRSGMRNEEEVAGGMMYSSNLYEIFQDYQKHIGGSLNEIGIESEKRGEILSAEQKEQLKEHVNGTLALDVELGAKLTDVFNRRPEGNLTWSDRAIDWLQNSNMPILRRIAANPGAAALLGAVGGNLASRGALRLGLVAGTAGLVTGAWLPILTGAISAGVFGAMRRNKELKYDRAMHQRQRTEGREYSDRFRRGRMDEFQYDIKSTKELDDELEGIIKATADSGGHYRNIPDDQKELLASMFARYKLELSQEQQRRAGMSDSTFDLIQAANPEEGERNNTHYLSKTDLKIKLYKYLGQNGLIDDLQKRPTDREFEQLFNTQSCALLDNIRQADRAFADYRVRSAATTGAVAGLSGAVGVFAGQALWNELIPGDRYTALDSARDFFRGDGSKKIEEFLPAIALGGQRLQPGLHEVDFHGEKFQLFVDPKTGTTIDPAQSHLPTGWRFENGKNGLSLIHEMTTKTGGGTIPAKNWNEFVEKNGLDNRQRVSYKDFKYQGTAPDKGVRALPETVANFLNNLKLKANSTELMMRFVPDKSGNGDILVDASRMLKETLKGAAGEKGNIMETMIKKGGKFFLALSESNNASQHNPILIPMDENGIMRVPANLAKTFFEFDNAGKLIEKNPGHGMKSFLFDTGMRRDNDGAMIAEGISNRLGEMPELKVPDVKIITTKEEFPFDFDPGKTASTPWAGGPAVASRWQLEERGKKGELDNKRDKKPTERQNIDFQREAKKIPADSIVSKAGESGRESAPEEEKVFSMGNATPEENEQTETVEVSAENQENSWKDYRKYFEKWNDTDELLEDLKLSNGDKVGKIDEAIDFFKNFDARDGIFPTRPRAKRDVFLKMFEKFKKKHGNNQISERNFILCLQERLQMEKSNQSVQTNQNAQSGQATRNTVRV